MRLLRFQHTAARRRLDLPADFMRLSDKVSTHSRPKAAGYPPILRDDVHPFQHTAARRRLAFNRRYNIIVVEFQHTAARRRLGSRKTVGLKLRAVSTHSRPKAAGLFLNAKGFQICSFNTQPPEGGWDFEQTIQIYCLRFNTQPPEGGWLQNI